MSALDALPSIPVTALPADVRKGSAADQKAYKAALGFERVLLKNVVDDMTKAGGLDDSPYASTIQDSFSDALTAGGGLGMGEQLYHSLRVNASKADTPKAAS
jgi:Rod binding domain-containing protein